MLDYLVTLVYFYFRAHQRSRRDFLNYRIAFKSIPFFFKVKKRVRYTEKKQNVQLYNFITPVSGIFCRVVFIVLYFTFNSSSLKEITFTLFFLAFVEFSCFILI